MWHFNDYIGFSLRGQQAEKQQKLTSEVLILESHCVKQHRHLFYCWWFLNREWTLFAFLCCWLLSITRGRIYLGVINTWAKRNCLWMIMEVVKMTLQLTARGKSCWFTIKLKQWQCCVLKVWGLSFLTRFTESIPQ